MTTARIGRAGLVLILTLAGMVGAVARAEEPAAGFEAHVDPETGGYTSRPPVPRSAQPEADASAEASALVERVGPTGGVVVELQGRFRSTVTATVDEAGTLHTRCADDAAPGAKDVPCP